MFTSSKGYLPGFYNVELHHHLDGSIRAQTVRDLAKEYNVPFDQEKFDQALENVDNLVTFLDCFSMFMPVLQGNPEAIERLAYECVEDQYNNKVAFFETRFAPFLMLANNESMRDSGYCQQACSAYDVVDAVLDGLERGEKDFGVRSTAIFCGLRGQTQWLTPLTRLLKHYRYHPKVVGIDMAGNENLPWSSEELELTKNLYRVARSLGYGCTFHAGEQGLVQNIERALDEIKTHRIGHGYAVFKDDKLLERCFEERVPFEFCPISAKTLSSLGTDFDDPNNPILLGSKKKLNFSLNCDDALFFGNIQPSIKICKDVLGFSEGEVFRIRENAARATFLPEEEKQKLIDHIVQRK